MAVQELVEPEAAQDVVHERQAAEGVGDECEAGRLSHPRVLLPKWVDSAAVVLRAVLPAASPPGPRQASPLGTGPCPTIAGRAPRHGAQLDVPHV